MVDNAAGYNSNREGIWDPYQQRMRTYNPSTGYPLQPGESLPRTGTTTNYQPTIYRSATQNMGGPYKTDAQVWNQFSNQHALLSQWNAPQFAQMNLDRSTILGNQAFGNEARANARADAYTNYNLGLRDQAVQNQDINWQRQYLNKQPGFINRQYGLDLRGAAQTENRGRDEFRENMMNLYHQVAPMGSIVSTGMRKRKDIIRTELKRDIEDANIQRGQGLLNKDRSMADNWRAQRALDTRAQQLGVDSDKLKAGLDKAIRDLGLEGRIDAYGVQQALSSNNLQQNALAQQINQAAADYVRNMPLSPSEMVTIRPGRTAPSTRVYAPSGGRGVR